MNTCEFHPPLETRVEVDDSPVRQTFLRWQGASESREHVYEISGLECPSAIS